MDYTTKKSVYSQQQTGVVIEESGSPAQAALTDNMSRNHAKAATPDMTLQIAELRRRTLISELKGLNQILGYTEK